MISVDLIRYSIISETEIHLGSKKMNLKYVIILPSQLWSLGETPWCFRDLLATRSGHTCIFESKVGCNGIVGIQLFSISNFGGRFGAEKLVGAQNRFQNLKAGNFLHRSCTVLFYSAPPRSDFARGNIFLQNFRKRGYHLCDSTELFRSSRIDPYVEKIFPPISSYLIQNYLCMCLDQCEWIWDRFFSLFIFEKSFWDRKIPFLGSKKGNSPNPHNYQNLKLKTTFRKTTSYCTKWYLMLVEVFLEYRESIISSFPTS